MAQPAVATPFSFSDDFLDNFWTSLNMSQPSTLVVKAPPKQWSDLPTEIKANILGHLEKKEDLKNCRLIDKTTGAEATRWLFHTVCFWPNSRCLEKLLEIAEHPEIAKYVRALECHRHQLEDLEYASCITDGFLADRLRVLDPIEASYQTHRLYVAYEQELTGQRMFKYVTIGRFRKILAQFPIIDSFIHSDGWIRAPNGDILLEENSSLWHCTGVRELAATWLTKGLPTSRILNFAQGQDATAHANLSMTYLPSALQRRLEALPHHNDNYTFQPVILELLAHHWLDFCSVMSAPEDEVSRFLEKVRSFRLIFEVQAFPEHQTTHESSVHWNINSTTFLRQLGSSLPSACSVWFGFDEKPLQTSDLIDNMRATSRISRLLLSSFYPQIKQITLENATVSSQVLRGFAGRHSNSLRSITIKNLHLVNLNKNKIDLVDRLLKLIIFTHDQTKLTRFSIQRVVEDITGMRVHCGEPRRDSLLHDVCEYVCHRGDFPFGVLRMFWDQYISAENVFVSGSSYVFKGKRNAKTDATLESDGSWAYENPTKGGFGAEETEKMVEILKVESVDSDTGVLTTNARNLFGLLAP